MEFEKYFDRIKDHKKFITDCGSDYLDEYAYEIKDGVQNLVKNGQTNIYEKIQVAAEGADVESIVNRFLNTGDPSSLNAAHGFYADTTQFPTTYAEMFSRVQSAENVFNTLDPEIKKAFNNNYKEFWSKYGTKDFEDIISSFVNNTESDRVDEKVIHSESEEK